MAATRPATRARGRGRGRGAPSRGGVRTGEAIAREVMANPATLQDAMNWNAKMYDKNAPGVKTRRARTSGEYLGMMRTYKPEGAELDDVAALEHYLNPDVAIVNVLLYLNSCARSTQLKGRISPEGKITAATLRQRLEALWWYAAYIAGRKAGELWTEWSHNLIPAVHKAAVEFGLGTRKWEKVYFGVPELRMLFDLTW